MTSLAEKATPGDHRDTHFPIADSEERFREKGTLKKIAKLTKADQDIIRSLKPYKGGNDQLYALNWLCNKGKHRKLILFGGTIQGFEIPVQEDTYIDHTMDVFSTIEQPLVPGMSLVRFSSKTVNDIDLNFLVEVTFNETAGIPRRPIVSLLREFSMLCRSIVQLFA